MNIVSSRTLFIRQTDRQTNEQRFAFLELLTEPTLIIIDFGITWRRCRDKSPPHYLSQICRLSAATHFCCCLHFLRGRHFYRKIWESAASRERETWRGRDKQVACPENISFMPDKYLANLIQWNLIIAFLRGNTTRLSIWGSVCLGWESAESTC